MQQLTGLIENIEENLKKRPKEASADAGYFTEDNLLYLEQNKISGYIAPGREGKDVKSQGVPDHGH
jgi:hypothetical protein